MYNVNGPKQEVIVEVCRIAARITETGAVVRGEYVFTPASIVDWIVTLNEKYAGTIIHWSECLSQLLIS